LWRRGTRGCSAAAAASSAPSPSEINKITKKNSFHPLRFFWTFPYKKPPTKIRSTRFMQKCTIVLIIFPKITRGFCSEMAE
jgi:hypothetical protein